MDHLSKSEMIQMIRKADSSAWPGSDLCVLEEQLAGHHWDLKRQLQVLPKPELRANMKRVGGKQGESSRW